MTARHTPGSHTDLEQNRIVQTESAATAFVVIQRRRTIARAVIQRRTLAPDGDVVAVEQVFHAEAELPYRQVVAAEKIEGGITVDAVALSVADAEGGGALYAQTPRIRHPADSSVCAGLFYPVFQYQTRHTLKLPHIIRHQNGAGRNGVPVKRRAVRAERRAGEAGAERVNHSVPYAVMSLILWKQ